jgi:hypothetical protein
MANLFRKIQDRPVPIESRGDTESKFSIIRDNIEILWKRVNKLIKDGDSSNSITSGTTVQAPAVTTPGTGVPPVHSHADLLKKSNFFGFHEAGNIAVSTSWVDVNIDTEVKEDGAFSHSGSNAEVEILETDYYEMLAEIGVKSETEGVTFEMRLMRDDGLGYLEVEGSRAFCKL